MAKNEQDVVYIGIEDPSAVRRGMLEASKSLVHILKGQHNLIEIRVLKQKGIEELRTTITDINEMLVAVKQLMPHTEKLNLSAGTRRTEGASKRTGKAGPAAGSPINSKVDKFEMQLQDIEDKVKSL